MKLIHKVEECAVYESNKQSYASLSSSSSSFSLPQVKTFLLKITSSNANAALALLSSVEKSVKRAHADAYNHTSTSIKFKALKAIPLKTFIDNMHSQSLSKGMAYTLTLKLLADVGTQLERIRSERGLIIPFLSLEDIVVIETRNQDNQNQEEVSDNAKSESRESDSEYTFLFMNAEKLMQEPGPNKNELIIDVPLKVNKHTSFLPAELPESALKRLPMRLTATSWCYSLSALCIYALLQHKFKNGEDDIERVGRPFLHTSLYFCLKRCLKPDPEERVLLYV